jgi:hypothetical protein
MSKSIPNFMRPEIKHRHKTIHRQNINVVLGGLGDLHLPALDDVLEAECVQVGNTHDQEEVPDGYLFGQQVVHIP